MLLKNPESPIDQALKLCLKAFYIVALFSLINTLLILAVPLYSLQVFDRVISSGSVDTLVMLSIIVVFALACWTLINIARHFVMIAVSEWLNNEIGDKIFARAVAIAAQTGTLVSGQAQRDLNELKTFITGQSLLTLIEAPWSIIFLIVLFLIHPTIGLIAFFGGLVLIAVAITNERATKKFTDNASKHFLKVVQGAELASRNAEVIESMGMLDNVRNSWSRESHLGDIEQKTSNKRMAVLSNFARFCRMVVQILVTGTGAYLVLQHEMTTGGMIAGSIISGRALAPCDAAIGLWRSVLSIREAYFRLKKISHVKLREEAMQLPEPKGHIDVENAIYVPVGGKKPIIYNVGFSLSAGDILGIIGASAAGKTSLSKLLVGVWQCTSGNIRLDGADVYSWNRKDFGKHTGYLPQDIELFSDTIKNNIAKMDEEATSEDVVVAAKIAGIHEMILKMPQGYDTVVGLGILSAGQRQRIGIARAFYGNPKLVVLDEPNANLDADGEAKLVETLKYAKDNKITTIIISHRTSILEKVDKLLLMKEGKLAIFGPRDKVLEKLKQTA